MASFKIILHLAGLLSVICFMISTSQVSACGETCKNGIYCKSNTTFYICEEDEAGPIETDSPFTCKEDTFCTDSTNICETTENIEDPDSGINELCPWGQNTGKCNAECKTGDKFKCVSETRYAECSNVNVVKNCNSSEYCSLDLQETGKKCASKAILEFFDYEITCSGSTELPETSDDFAKVLCKNDYEKNKLKTNKILNTADKTCITYIYCEKLAGENEFVALVLTCKNGFFDEKKRNCVSDVPENCPLE